MKKVQIKFTFRPFGQFVANITGFCDCACEKEQEYNSTNVVTMATLLVADVLVLMDRKEMTVLALLLIEQTEPIRGVLNPRVVRDACECSNYECDTGSSGLVCSGCGNCTCLGDIQGTLAI